MAEHYKSQLIHDGDTIEISVSRHEELLAAERRLRALESPSAPVAEAAEKPVAYINEKSGTIWRNHKLCAESRVEVLHSGNWTPLYRAAAPVGEYRQVEGLVEKFRALAKVPGSQILNAAADELESALQSQGIPEGYVVVPREPTEEMVEDILAWCLTDFRLHTDLIKNGLREIIAKHLSGS